MNDPSEATVKPLRWIRGRPAKHLDASQAIVGLVACMPEADETDVVRGVVLEDPLPLEWTADRVITEVRRGAKPDVGSGNGPPPTCWIARAGDSGSHAVSH